MNRRLPLGSPAAGADSGTTSPPAISRPARRLIAVMLVAAAALDLTRCGLVMGAGRHPPSAAGLVMIGLAAAALSVRTARGCQSGQRWAVWAALLTGAASAPQAAMSGFSTTYTIPDTATAVLGVLLGAAVLATAGRTGVPGDNIHSPCAIARDDPMIRDAAAPEVAPITLPARHVDASHQQGSRQPWRARTRHASGLTLLAVRAHVTMHRQSGCR
jgi:hypothetical protein